MVSVMTRAVYRRPNKRGERAERIDATYVRAPEILAAGIMAEMLAIRHPEGEEVIRAAYAAMREQAAKE